MSKRNGRGSEQRDEQSDLSGGVVVVALPGLGRQDDNQPEDHAPKLGRDVGVLDPAGKQRQDADQGLNEGRQSLEVCRVRGVEGVREGDLVGGAPDELLHLPPARLLDDLKHNERDPADPVDSGTVFKRVLGDCVGVQRRELGHACPGCPCSLCSELWNGDLAVL
ncbi:hypothetical protein OIY81_3345 [Cryptosporidium canis]|nr:hypothetical protein OIY81_3345 [Cryptosporidium canis]